MRSNQLIIYGANGYTGRLIVALAADYQLAPMLAGRNESELRDLATSYHLSYSAFTLSDKQQLHAMLQDSTLVLHVAGPFRHTARQMIEACIETKTHYIDITGEIEVFEMAKQYDVAAKQAGIMIMPGAGFDVVPTDCLALHLKNKMPDAVELRLAFASLGGAISHGTAMTMIEGLGEGGAIRENGVIKRKPLGHEGRWMNFGSQKLFVMAIPWGDVSTAYHTTGIPDITTYTTVPRKAYLLLKFQFFFNWLMKTKFLKSYLKKQMNKRPAGPAEAARKKAKSLVWGEVRNTASETAIATMETPDGYTLTAHSSLIIAKKIIEGNFKPGYQTPASAYGADLILQVPSVKREDRRE